jgi:hypothetical protein
MLDAGCFPYRSSISIDKLLKPLPAMASEETGSSASVLLHGKRMRREDADGDLGCVKEEGRASQVEAHEVEGDAARLGCPWAEAVDATTNAGVTAEAGPMQMNEASAEEVIAMGVAAPCIATDEVAAGEAAAAEASPGPTGQEEAREVAEETMKETPAGAETLEPSEVVAQASSSTIPTPGTKADIPVPRMEIDTAANPPRFRADAGSEKASQGAPTACAGEGERGEASTTPGAAAKGASGGKILAASTGSGASSQSSASQLQKEWADTASSASSGGSRKTKGENLTLAELSKQLATVKASPGNVSF